MRRISDSSPKTVVPSPISIETRASGAISQTRAATSIFPRRPRGSELPWSDASALTAYNDFLAKDLPVLWMPNPVYQVSAYKSGLQGVVQDPMNGMYFQDWSWK